MRPQSERPRSGPGIDSWLLGAGVVTLVGAGYFVSMIYDATSAAEKQADATSKPNENTE